MALSGWAGKFPSWKVPRFRLKTAPFGLLRGGRKYIFIRAKTHPGTFWICLTKKSVRTPTFRLMPIGQQTGAPTAAHGQSMGARTCAGWKFVYVDAKLRKIEAPSGQYIDFTYANGKLASVEQRGRAFISLKYNEDKLLSEILINGVSNKFVFIDGKAQILPETLAGKEEYIESKFLSKVGQDGLNPLEFSYDNAGYLMRVLRSAKTI